MSKFDLKFFRKVKFLLALVCKEVSIHSKFMMKYTEQEGVIENSSPVSTDTLQEPWLTQLPVFGVSFISMIGSTQILDVQLAWTGT